MTLLLLACIEADGVGASGSAYTATADDALTLPDLAGQSILILQVDTLRADHVSAYGHPIETLPSLMQRNWLVVEGERAAGVWTMPSTASFMTGLDQYHHDLRWMDEDGGVNHEMQGTPFPERLTLAGYATLLATGNPMASSKTGVSRGFGVEELVSKADILESDSPYLADIAIGFVEALPADQPFLVHLQPADAHSPLLPDPQDAGSIIPEPSFPIVAVNEETQAEAIADAVAADDFARKSEVDAELSGVYDEALLGVDRSFERVLVALEEMGRLDDTFVVLTSDHGESLGEDGYYGHGDSLREELVRLPLLFLHPGLDGGRVECSSRNLDVWPTLWAAMGEEPIDGLDGTDLAHGCPARAPVSAWNFGGGLMGVGMAGSDGKISDLCDGAGAAGTALGAGADPDEATPAAKVPGGSALLDDLGVYQATLAASVADGACE
jgi:arylsulfatase